MSEETTRSRSRISVVRLLVLAVGLGVIAAVIAAVAYYAYRESRDGPLQVKVYPGATQTINETVREGYDHQRYVTTDSLEKIEQFYAGQDGMACEPQYAQIIEQPGADPIKEGYLYTRCIKDRSSLNMTQYTVILLQPVVDGSGSPTGEIVIDVERHWG